MFIFGPNLNNSCCILFRILFLEQMGIWSAMSSWSTVSERKLWSAPVLGVTWSSEFWQTWPSTKWDAWRFALPALKPSEGKISSSVTWELTRSRTQEWWSDWTRLWLCVCSVYCTVFNCVRGGGCVKCEFLYIVIFGIVTFVNEFVIKYNHSKNKSTLSNVIVTQMYNLSQLDS